jgi:hypothetical protein
LAEDTAALRKWNYTESKRKSAMGGRCAAGNKLLINLIVINYNHT